MSTNEFDLTFSRYCVTEAESEGKQKRARINRQRSSEDGSQKRPGKRAGVAKGGETEVNDAVNCIYNYCESNG